MKKLLNQPFLCLKHIGICFCVFIACLLCSKNLQASDLADKLASFIVLVRSEAYSNDAFFFQDSLTDKNDIAAFAALGRARPGFNHSAGILIENKNNNDAFGISLTIKYNQQATFLNCNSSYVMPFPGQVEIYIDTLPAAERLFFTLDFSLPPNSNLIGQNLWVSAEVSLPAFDLNPANNYDNTSCKISGSFDPNAKAVEPEGFDWPNYIPVTQEELKYTIFFQNTGTDTAFNVTVTDTISGFLDPYSIQPGAASHPYSWEILAPDVVKFHFININLPDSNVDEPASHGFISFRIKTNKNLVIGDNIKNSAYIFFDFNPAVATNTLSNELFDCNSISSFSLTQNSLCGGDTIMVFQNSVIPHISKWYLDSLWIGSGDSLSFNSFVMGHHNVMLVAETPYCKQQISWPLTIVVPPKPLIYHTGFLLSTPLANTYQWFSNGQSIPGAQSSTYLATSQGWYAVLISDASNCKAMSDSVFISSVGIQAFNEASILLTPNPFKDNLVLETPENEEVSIQLIALDGKIVKSVVISDSGKKITINTSDLAIGIYTLRFRNKTGIYSKLVAKIN